MDFSPEWLQARLAAWPKPRRYVVLISGGVDSTVLLHAMGAIADSLSASVVALHFNHGLSPEADAWENKVTRHASSLGMVCYTESLNLDAEAGAVETRAREARYARLREWISAGDCCLTAHHGNDQAETFLLQALRGAGLAGLAAMPEHVRFGSGWLGRPLLPIARAQLQAWAEARSLQWVEDPGNRDMTSPRNRLRRWIWPDIASGWPAATRTLGRCAALAAEAAELIEEVASETLARIESTSKDRLSVPALLELSGPRRRAVLRYWLRNNGVETPAAEKLQELEREYVLRDPGASAQLPLGSVRMRRFRDQLFVVHDLPEPPEKALTLVPGEYRDLGALGRIGLIIDANGPVGPVVGMTNIELRFRCGGETLRPAGEEHRRALKKLLQERDILPWMRFRLPLLYVDGQLAAVGDIMVAEEFAGRSWRLDWRDAPALQ